MPLSPWLLAAPLDQQPALRARLRGPPEGARTAAFELGLSDLLRALDPHLRFNEALPNGKTPDFTLCLPEGPVIVEAVTSARHLDNDSGRRAVVDLLAALAQLEHPHLHLCATVQGPTPRPLPRAEVIQRARDWLRTLDSPRPASRTLCIRGAWSLVAHALPSPSSEAIPFQTVRDLRSTLRRKARKYPRPGAPYLIAVNVLRPSPLSRRALIHTLCGDDQRTGVWRGPQGPVNPHVSAVLFVDRWSVDRHLVARRRLIHNPAAERPLGSGFDELCAARGAGARP